MESRPTHKGNDPANANEQQMAGASDVEDGHLGLGKVGRTVPVSRDWEGNQTGLRPVRGSTGRFAPPPLDHHDQVRPLEWDVIKRG